MKNLKMQLGFIGLIVLLLVNPQFNNPVHAVEDSNPPTLTYLSFNTPVVNAGDKVTVIVGASDDLSGISYIEVGFADPTGTWKAQPFPAYNASTGYYDASILIDQFWLSGIYYIDFVYISDNAGNGIYLYNGTDFTSPTVNVVGTSPDTTAPTVNNFYFNSGTASPTSPITVSLNLNDSESGISHVEVGIADPTGTWKAQPFPVLNPINGLWEAVVNIDQYWLGGNYYIDFIYTADNAGNGVYRSNGTDFISPTFNVIGTTPDVSPPDLWWMSFSQISTSSDNPFKVSLNITDDLSGISHVEVGIADPTGTWKAQPFPALNPVTNLWEAEVNIDQFWLLGTYYIAFVLTVDNAGNSIYRYNGSDFISPTIEVVSNTPDIYPPLVYANLTSYNTYSGAFFVEVVSNETGWGEVYVNGVYYSGLIFESTTTIFWFDSQQFLNGNHNMTIWVSDNSGNSVSVSYLINIDNIGAPLDERIYLDVSPINDVSFVNETVLFDVKIETTFLHDMPNVTLVVDSLQGNGISRKVHESSFFLGRQSSVSFTIPIHFIREGVYFIDVVLYDDISVAWAFTFEWTVKGELTSDPVTTQTNPEATSTSTDTGASTDTTQTPELPVPGYSLIISFFSFIAIISTRIKKRNK